VGRELLVGVREGLELVVDQILVKWVEEDLLLATRVLAHLGGPAVDATGGDDVLEDGSVHSLQGTGARAHLAWVVDRCNKSDWSVNTYRSWR